jgi:hypothetical protein
MTKSLVWHIWCPTNQALPPSKSLYSLPRDARSMNHSTIRLSRSPVSYAVWGRATASPCHPPPSCDRRPPELAGGVWARAAAPPWSGVRRGGRVRWTSPMVGADKRVVPRHGGGHRPPAAERSGRGCERPRGRRRHGARGGGAGSMSMLPPLTFHLNISLLRLFVCCKLRFSVFRMFM